MRNKRYIILSVLLALICAVSFSANILSAGAEEFHDPHDFTYCYEYLTPLFHNAYCECGVYTRERHSMHNDACMCGFALPSHNHSFDFKYVQYDKSYHLTYCSCGFYFLEAHIFRSNICLSCGYIFIDIGFPDPPPVKD